MINTIASFAAGTVPGLVQLIPDNINSLINYSAVLLHIPIATAVLNRLEDGPLRAMIL